MIKLAKIVQDHQTIKVIAIVNIIIIKRIISAKNVIINVAHVQDHNKINVVVAIIHTI